MIVTFSKEIESPVFSGTIESFKQYTYTTYQKTLGAFQINADVISERQYWFGMRSSTSKGVKYVYKLEKTNPNFTKNVRVIEPITIKDLAARSPVTITNPPDNTTKVFVNFEGKGIDFVDWYSSVVGKLWYMNADGTVSLLDIPSSGTIQFPTSVLDAEFEKGRINGFSGVQYQTYSWTSTPHFYQVQMQRPRFRFIIEQPFKSDNKQYVIVNAEYIEDVGYADFDVELHEATPPIVQTIYIGTATKGLSETQTKDVFEYDWYWEGNTTFRFKFRVAVEYPETATDPNKAIVDAFCAKLGVHEEKALTQTQFQIIFNRKYKTVSTQTLGQAPFREISIAGMPIELTTNVPYASLYASKSNFLYCHSQRMRFSQFFKTDFSGIPNIGTGFGGVVKGVSIEYDEYSNSAIVDVEVIGQ